MAKGIANGFPLGAFITRPDIAEAFTPGDHLSTFGGNPVSCAAAMANIDVMSDEKLPQNATVRGDELMSSLIEFKEKYSLVGDVRGKGLMIGIELIKDKNKTPASEEARQIRKLCREAGVLIGTGGVFGNVLRLQPPLVLTAEESQRVLDVLEKSLVTLSEPVK
jgi:4-aminobutyrate aminotransferase-like enzyme